MFVVANVQNLFLVLLGAYYGRTPVGLAEGLEEDVALFAIDGELSHALVATLHGVAKFNHHRVGGIQGVGDFRLLEKQARR